MSRLEVLKTYKLYIGGQFPRTESGRYYAPKNAKQEVLGNICLSSRKDVRNAVSAARKAMAWSERTAFNRGQILYRIAEMLEGRKAQFIEELKLQGASPKAAEAEVNVAIDRIVYYAGWCDKYQQILGSVNPVASSHFNFSVPEPTGVVGIVCPEDTSLVGLVSLVLPVICGGNTCVVLASESHPLCAITFAEVLHSSDLPGGVVNILTGSKKELVAPLASHMDVNAILYGDSNADQYKALCLLAAENVKRVAKLAKDWSQPEQQDLYQIAETLEIKTTWHPIENIGGASSGY
jgi:acyl-CoA reductase-like NAD-dependent aldehyde dehydrogenase